MVPRGEIVSLPFLDSEAHLHSLASSPSLASVQALASVTTSISAVISPTPWDACDYIIGASG